MRVIVSADGFSFDFGFVFGTFDAMVDVGDDDTPDDDDMFFLVDGMIFPQRVSPEQAVDRSRLIDSFKVYQYNTTN